MGDSDWLFEERFGAPAESTPADPAGDPDATTVEPADARPSRSSRQRFRDWRHSRPFWGGLLALLAGAEIAALPLSAYKIILVAPNVTLAAGIGFVILILGVLVWMSPEQNKLYGLLTVLLGVVSFVTSNLGGFVVGGILAILGGALAFAWDVLPEETVEPHVAQPPEEPGVHEPETHPERHEAGQR